MSKFKSILCCVLLPLSIVACRNTKVTDNNTDDGDIVNGDKVVTAYVTTASRSSEFVKNKLAFSSKVDNMSPLTVTLVPSQQYQVMDGFGAAITGSSAYNLLKMSTDDRTRFLTETFSDTEGMGQSYVRVAIGCSDFSLSEYTCCDEKGSMENPLQHFSLQNEELNYVIPVLKEILAINPNIKVMGTPWTPPIWMKVNNLKELKPFKSWTSGQLNPAHYQDYAEYFVRWIEAMEGHGIKIYSVTPQNEPLNRGNSASMFMGWEEQNTFVKEALGPKFKDVKLDTKIYLFDHNYNYDNMSGQYQYPLKIYADAATSQYVAGAAYHNYGGNRSELLEIHKAYPDKELVFTETSIGEWNDGRNLQRRLIEDMEEVALGTVSNWCRGVIVWNLMLDMDKKPYRPGGCGTCYGAVDIDQTDYKRITKNSHYFITGHLSAVVKPGAVRIGTSGYTDKDLVYAAFKNTDGSYAFVVLNKSASVKKVNLYDGVKSFIGEIPAKAVISYRWVNNN